MEKKIRVMDLPKNERPRERLLRYGADALSNVELLAIVLSTGSQQENVLDLSSRIMKTCGGLNGLLAMSADNLMDLSGIGKAKASQMLAIVEISKRFKSFHAGEEIKICKPIDAANIVMENMRCLKQERLRVIMLNTKNIIISVKDISIGSLNSSIVHPREVFAEAIKKSSASIIVCHNHPSGDPTPSNEDINITHRLKECGKILGIELVDHIIIGDGVFTSLKEKGIL